MARYVIYMKKRGGAVQGILNNGLSVGSLDEAKRIAKFESEQRIMNRSDTIKIYREIKTIYPDDLTSDRAHIEFDKYLKTHGYVYMDLNVLAPVGEVWWDGTYFSYKSNRVSIIDDKRISKRISRRL